MYNNNKKKKLLFQELKALNRRGLERNNLIPISKRGKPSRCVPSCQVLRWSIRITSQNESNSQTTLFTDFDSAGKRKRKALALWYSILPHGRTPGKDQMEAQIGGVISLLRSPEQKAPAFLWTCGATGRKRGKN